MDSGNKNYKYYNVKINAQVIRELLLSYQLFLTNTNLQLDDITSTILNYHLKNGGLKSDGFNLKQNIIKRLRKLIDEKLVVRIINGVYIILESKKSQSKIEQQRTVEKVKNIKNNDKKENTNIVKSENLPKILNKDAIKLKIFISHSSKDAIIMSNFIKLLKASIIEIEQIEIICSSVSPHKFKSGDDFYNSIKKSANSSSLILGMLSNNSLNSDTVLFECGIGWYLDNIIPIIIDKQVTFKKLPHPLQNKITKKIFNVKELKELILDLAERLKLEPKRHLDFDAAISDFSSFFNKLIKDEKKKSNLKNNSNLQTPDKIKIQYAFYSSVINPKKGNIVTKTIQNFIKTGGNNFKVTWKNFEPDPDPGNPKQLILHYIINGVLRKNLFKDETNVILD